MHTKSIYFICLSTLVFLPHLASAGDENFLEMDLEQLLQVKVTGSTLRDESLKTVPSSVTVFTRKQLDMLGLDYLHELMNLVPGFQTTRNADSPNSYAFSVRGRRQGARSREVMLLVDGREFSGPRGGGADTAVSLYPLANIERIEIIRGPGSAIYGSGAMMGVINIVSRRQQQQVAVASGSDGRRRVDLQTGFKQGDWQGDLYAYGYRDDGQEYRLPNNAETQDPRQQAVFDLSLSYQNTHLSYFHSRIRGDDFYNFEKILNSFNRYIQTFEHLRLDQSFQPTDNWALTLAGSYLESEQYNQAVFAAPGAMAAISEPSSSEPFLVKAELASYNYRVSLANDLTLSDAHSAQFGIDWQHVRETRARAMTNYDLTQLAAHQIPVTYSSEFDLNVPLSAEEGHSVTGIYGQMLFSLTDQTRLTLGGRYDHYQTDSRISPRFAFVHQFNPQHTVKLLYGEAFRAPSITETDLLNNPVLVGNPELGSEVVKTWELVWLSSWESVSFHSSLYHNNFVDPIEAGLLGTARTFINGETVSYWGGNLGLDWQFSPNWLLSTNYDWMDDLPASAFREADRLPQLGLMYDKGAWSWSLTAVYHAERQYQLTATQLAPLDAYWLTNTQWRYAFSPTLSMTLALKNALDEEYSTPTQGAGIGGVPNRRREWNLGAEWRW